MNDGWRAVWKDEGRNVITVRSPKATGIAVAAVHLPSSLLSSHFH